MRKITTLGAVMLSSLAVATVATAANENGGGNAKNLAAKQCAAEKKADKAAFKATYGDHAMRDCIKGATPAFKNAVKECKAERAEDPDAFRETYGSNQNERNALGKCVSARVRDGAAA